MTAQVDMVNRSLQTWGSRTTVTAAELANNGSNEAIQANLAYVPFRRRLLRMAPWNSAQKSANLNYITSAPGTPENAVSPAVSLWGPGLPAPPWAYEYQYPVDCLRALWVVPQTATGFASGIPITTAVTGGAPTFWQGPPVKFGVAQDNFFMVSAATIVAPGAGYAVGDFITVALQPNAALVNNVIGQFQPLSPQGAAAILQVASIGGGGAIATVNVVNAIAQEANPISGSYFYVNAAAATQASTTGAGSGATFNFTFTGPKSQRVILTNQEFAILSYIADISDENIWDDSFQEAYALVLGARLCVALSGDKKLANLKIAEANAMILEARGTDANEGLKVNDVTPDWLRIRGINYTEDYSGPYDTGYNYGALWPGYT